jgi:phosphatidylserine decarboxylase
MEIPVSLRYSIFNLYSKYYGVILDEVELPLKNYPTFGDFFTRKITRK